ncbi:conserved hypothetical protein [Pyrenophora tritici-repentis Pt-1C-BFP]|uniref:FAD-binding FR-type domain-containing protein n=1 Tax=Pyrenophora tritici-repentis (strain Pt-1C-BFP) TaxID=426418 RepID=B2WP91_PYRTR|nr:uncharacterized protein PTRG_11801 [Pyrenophora tritici-repentis Pt-1C-BFP]EDU45957.1 conserved hypothetical protein [Pyrenophora tritici-repentis Pt-1C-BFP]
MDLFTRHEAHHEVEASRYWALGYYFENLSNEQLHRQRRYLDLYGFAAEWSVWVIFVLFQVGFAFLWVMKNTLRHKQPKSPSFTKDQKSRLGWLRQIYGGYTKTTWWMQKDVIKGWNWGTRGEWIGAVAWTMWLLYLCIANTGKGHIKGMLKLLSGTNLIQGSYPVTSDSAVLRWSPGQHVYLSRPRRKGKAPTWYNQWFMMRRANPFTVASLPSKDRELLLIIKTLNGNTKYLGELVRSLAKGSGTTVPILPTAGGDTLTLPLALEGPYGASARLPDLLGYDRVLLVAGGIGATFIMPIYRDILGLHDNVPTDNQIRCVWTVQKLAETQWAFATNSSSGDRQDEEGVGSEDTGTHADRNSLVHGSSNIEVYVTRSAGLNLRVNATASNNFAVDSDDEGGETIEMQENDQLLDMDEQVQKPHESMLIKSGRPDLKGIVEEVFSKGVKIAVICCGPKRMIDDLRSGVEVWVNKDHEVFWHNETFDW